MIFMPPRFGKSEQVTVRYPVWRLERNPAYRVMIGAYNSDLATNFSSLARDVALQRRLPIREDHNRADDWKTTAGGGVRAVGVGKGATGFGADLIIIDDPVRDQSEADSEAYQRSVWDWYTKVIRTRLEPGGAIILIMTRWSEEDLAGKLLDRAKHGGEKWDVCRLPAFAETQAERDLWAREMGLPEGEPDPIGRQPGEGLCSERFSDSELRATMEDVGPRGAEALYQQRPRPAEGALFKREWFDLTDDCPPGLNWVRYWDLAVETKTVNDHSASVAVALDDRGELWIRDLVYARQEWPDVRAKMIDTFEDEHDRFVVQAIEKAVQGNAAVQEMHREPRVKGCIIKGVDVKGDKLVRALAWQSKAELRKVHLVTKPSIRHCLPNWTETFLAEVCSFGPGSKKDDIVDSVSGGYQEHTSGTLARALGIVVTGKTRGW